MATYSADRQAPLERLLIEPARRLPRARFVVAGPQYPAHIEWPANVERIVHLSPQEHRRFYNAQRFTLSITRAAMVRAGYSPRGGLFEAGACGTPVLSDRWQGLDGFFTPGAEILLVESAEDVVGLLGDISEAERTAISERARMRVLREHTPAHRALALEAYVREVQEA